jgi:DNA polymerase I
MPSGERELLLLDVYALVYRAYFALPPLTTSAGQPVNAVYGFERMLNRVLNMERPTHVAACFDAGIPPERFEAMPTYKAQRPEMPADLAPQFDSVRRVLDAYGIRAIQVKGEEADDCIATLSTRASKDGIRTAIVSGDLDLLQLVDERTTVVVTRRGISDLIRYDPEAVRERFGLDPGQLPDYRGLKGDPSDNLPGVPGIGEKTATKLIAQYGTLDALLERAGEVTPKRIADLLVTYADQASRCRSVSVAKRQLPIDVAWDELKYEKPTRESIAALYAAFEFRTLLGGFANGQPSEAAAADPIAQLSQSAAAQEDTIDVEYRTIDESASAAAAINALHAGESTAIAFVPAGVSWRSPAVSAVGFSGSAGRAFVVPAALVLDDARVRAEFAALVADPQHKKIVHDAKAFYGWTLSAGFEPSPAAFDTMLAAGLVDSTIGEPTVGEAARLAGVSVTIADLASGPSPMDLFAAPESLDPALAASADAAFRASEPLARLLRDAHQDELLRDVELPLAAVIARLEAVGFRLNLDELDRIRAELDGMIAGASAEIYRIAGEEFNLNSPKAVGTILFEKLALPGGIKKKTGYATGLEILGPLAGEHAIAAKMLEYREVAKLKSTYVDALPALVDKKTGRVHTTLHQLGAATGRLSSTNPNLQNIPVRTAAGRAIRRAFLPPRTGDVFLAADYSQIELRLFAHLSGDRNLVEAFIAGQDVHAYTARAIFGVPADVPLDPQLRHRAKAINFGVLYGMGSFGLAQSAGITRAEAREFIAQYFARFPQIKQYIDAALARARTEGFVTTLLGRRRHLPDLRSSNHGQRAAAERMAVNAPLQGSAADLIKVAMVRAARAIDEAGLDARMLLQVHDELIFDVHPDRLDALRAVVRDAMEGAMRLAVPLVVDFRSGPTWADVE